MNVEDAQEYTESLGQIFAGSWRQIAWADRQGIPAALGLTTREWVEQRLGGYVRLAIADRRDAVAELTAEGMLQHEVAEVLGVSEPTVSRDARALSSEIQDADDQHGSDVSVSGETTTPVIEEVDPDALAKQDRADRIDRSVEYLRRVHEGWRLALSIEKMIDDERDEALRRLTDETRASVEQQRDAIHLWRKQHA